MFVPVACLKCGKPFQVPRAAAGTEVACPWCQATTPALPVAGEAVTPVAHAPGSDKPPAAPEPLSLDDEPTPAPAAAPPAAPRRPPYRTILIGAALTIAVFAATVAALGYGAGRVPASAWVGVTAPDGSCAFALPGEPTEEDVGPNPASGVTRGGKRFVTTGWYSGTTAWVGWQDLDPGWAKDAANDRDGVLITPVLTAERDRRKEQVHGTVAREAAARFNASPGLEVQMDTPRGRLAERYIVVAGGPRPRLYFLGVESKAAAPDGPVARKLFNSFRLAE